MIVQYKNEHGHICFEDFKKVMIVKEKDKHFVYGTHLSEKTCDVYDEDLLCVVEDADLYDFVRDMALKIKSKAVLVMPGA